MKVEYINPPTLHPPMDNMYAQVVRSEGRYLYRLSGQVSIGLDCKTIGKGNMQQQLEVCYDMVTRGLSSVGLTWANVIHIYSFTTDMDEYMKHEQGVARRYFGDKPPASTLLEVRRLVDPDWLVEVQVDAVGG
jgi:2-iminobutanoate/2-iminopropanoate deaminase